MCGVSRLWGFGLAPFPSPCPSLALWSRERTEKPLAVEKIVVKAKNFFEQSEEKIFWQALIDFYDW